MTIDTGFIVIYIIVLIVSIAVNFMRVTLLPGYMSSVKFAQMITYLYG